jgi:uncharacterized Fe-S cluster-containing radical SAM superfamily protein
LVSERRTEGRSDERKTEAVDDDVRCCEDDAEKERRGCSMRCAACWMKATRASYRRASGSAGHAVERRKAKEENEGEKWRRQAGGRLVLGLQERLQWLI